MISPAQVVKKRQKDISDIDQKIISMYAKGMTTRQLSLIHIYNVSKEIKEYGMIKTFLPEATALERAVTYRDKKIKPLFIEMKNKIGAMAALVKELTRERDSWKSKFQKKKQEHEKTKKELAEVQKDYQKLSGEKEILQGIADRYNTTYSTYYFSYRKMYLMEARQSGFVSH